LNSENYSIVFTKCDKTNMLEEVNDDDEPELLRYRNWLDEATKVALKKDDTFKEIDDDRIFFC
jgi:hypothetical protein